MAMPVAIVECSDDDASDILDDIMGIMEADEDGPQPRRGERKRLNGAEQFYAGYHADYMNKLKENKDRVGRAQKHNAGFPKLHNALDKRRSIIEVTTIDARSIPIYCDPNCSACIKLITLNELQRQNLKHKCFHDGSCRCKCRDRVREVRGRESRDRSPLDRSPRDRTPRDKRLRDIRSRISKHKPQLRRTTLAASTTMTAAYNQCRESKSCQYKFTIYVQDENIGTNNSVSSRHHEDTKLIERPSMFIPTAPDLTIHTQSRHSNISQNVSDPGSKSFMSRYSSSLSLSRIGQEPMVHP